MARSVLFGISVAPGIAIGKIVRTHHAGKIDEHFITPEEINAEIQKLRLAAERVGEDLQTAKSTLSPDLVTHSALIQTHIMISRDPRLLKEAEERIRTQRLCAAWALQKTVEALCTAFLDIDDPYLRDRVLDVRAVGLRLQCSLAGKEYMSPTSNTPSIHMAEDLSPADTMDLRVDRILALVMAEGGAMSHTAILARSLRIPAMVGVTGILEIAREGELVIVDALQGCVYIEPNEEELRHFSKKQKEYAVWESNVRRSAHLPAETIDGVRFEVQANLENAGELNTITDYGAEGVGLYRTEYAYLRSRQLPTEEQLYAEYSAVVRKLAPQRVVFRLLDVGADKILHSQMSLKESNPSLGLRAIRFCMRHQDLLRTQLRALLRAALHGNMVILAPMISGLDEVQFIKRTVNEVRQELCSQNIEHAAHVPLGIMIEVPSAVLIADALARECDFFSIGTNDLIHYLLAIDRGNKHVAYLHHPLHPAVTRSLKRVVDCAHREGIEVGLCGEMATDPYCLAMLIGMGIDSFSATPQSIPTIKHLIRSLDAEKCHTMTHSMLMTTDIMACTHIATEALAQSLQDHFSFCTTLLQTNK